MTRSALVVGVDRYDRLPDMRGCSNDAVSIATRLVDDQQPWSWGSLEGDNNIVLMGHFDAGEFRLRLNSMLRRAQGGAFFLYFAGHGFARRNDLVLADSSYDPDHSRNVINLQKDVLDVIKTLGVDSAVILLDCAGSEIVGQMQIPIGTVVVANPGEARTHDGYFASVLVRGLGGEGEREKAPGSAWNSSGTVTTMSLLTYAMNAVATRTKWKPLLHGMMSNLMEIRSVEVVTPKQMAAVRPLIRHEGEHLVIDVFPDMEYDLGTTASDLIDRLGWDPDGVAEFEKRAQARGLEFSFRSRPPHYDNGKDARQMEHPAEFQMDCLKAMIEAGLAQVVEPDSTLFWACLNWGQVRLTEAGCDWYRHT